VGLAPTILGAMQQEIDQGPNIGDSKRATVPRTILQSR
jgi:hypothetical protein